MLKMFKNLRRLNIKKFCEKLDRQEKRTAEYTYIDVKNFLAEAEANVNNGTYIINSIPDNNYFSEVPIYMAPHSSMSKLKINEFSGVLLTGTFFALAYSKIIFANVFFIPFFGLMTLTTLFRYSVANKLLDTHILRITLVDEGKVKITYYSGKNEVINIKNLYIASRYSDQLASIDDKKSKDKRKIVEDEDNNLNKNLKIVINADVNVCTLIVKSSGMASKVTNDDVAYLNSKILFGILCKKTKKLSLKDN
jgi:hypothetical protein